MRRRAEEEHVLVERLKREGGSPGLSATEADRRVRELKRQEREASAEAPRRSTAGLFKAVCSTDLLFLIDTTGSMACYIEAAKQQVRSIINDIGVAFLNEAEVRMAVVGYKDHGDSPNIQFLDFTPSVDQVRSFLNELSATGGNDAPEDVLGGIRQALNATWKHQTRCIIHIADAPPHGRTLHDLGDGADSYSTPGSEPHGLTHAQLLSQMVGLRINYALLRVNNSTDRMAFTFLQAYAVASPDRSLLKTNKYYSQACSSTKRSSTGGLLFQEADLGITFSALRHLVVKAVTASATRTAARSAPRMSKAGAGKKLDSQLVVIEEDDDRVPDVRLEAVSPQWNTPGWLNETLMLEGFSLDVMVHDANTLNDMMAHDDNITMSVLELTIHKRRQPFAQGSIRVASYARTAVSTNRYVAKSFERGDSRLAELAEGVRCQALCKSFALEFNALLGDEHSIDFIVTACFKGKSGGPLGDTCISLEPFLEGTYVKYNSNVGYVNEDIPDDPSNQAAQAFSHFTFERSRGHFLVSDLQGVGELLTDPAIHTLDPERFIMSTTNFGEDGFKFFFASHECNNVCRKLGLKSSVSMIISGRYEFREDWPSMADAVCCSNKLCGRILRRTSANESEKFPGYHWCDICWPQLESFMVKWICVGPAPYHEFEVSRFFYESQGRSTPRKCSEHREEDVIAPRATVPSGKKDATIRRTGAASRKKGAAVLSTAVADGSFWDKLKSATVALKGD
ncbi:hypothetical protein AOQ84DRAFT_321073 [Glonium stellatum]|uniref:Alpha-type protein kinase domain-containing protein n=1 Tax=Glonium stellatum TaxID=574774 RepID=A0A8E2EXH3_9PEZI|nr:hypothetical protein AOQ84DRAFT_321073 [Glonium stellatum]